MSIITDKSLKKLGESIEKIAKEISKSEETPHTRIAIIKLNEATARLNQEVADRASYKKVHGKKKILI